MGTRDVTVPPQSAHRLKWYEIWWHIWTNPGPNAFRKILLDPGAKSNRGFIWIAVAGFIVAIASSIVAENLLYINSSICEVTLAPAIAVLAVAIVAGIMHAVAKIFRGSGTWGNLAYCFAAVSAPAILLSISGDIFSSIYFNSPSTYGGSTSLWAFLMISLAQGIYILVLYISAIEAVEKIGTGKAVATYFISFFVLLLLALCAIAAILLPMYPWRNYPI